MDPKSTTPKDGDLLSTGDIAALAGVAPDTVKKWAQRHPPFRLLADKTSAGYVWRRRDAETWLRETGRERTTKEA